MWPNKAYSVLCCKLCGLAQNTCICPDYEIFKSVSRFLVDYATGGKLRPKLCEITPLSIIRSTDLKMVTGKYKNILHVQ